MTSAGTFKSLAFRAVDDHPFRMAWRTRDLDAWIEALSPEIVLHSPVVRTPFRGRSAARELYGVLFETFGEVELVGELADADSHAFFWRANVAGRVIEGADRLRYDEQGKIVEITVLIRPLVDIAVFAAAIGPPLAARKSPTRGALVRVLTLPLKGILNITDAVASRLIELD
jgi:SnoaL-like domain